MSDSPVRTDSPSDHFTAGPTGDAARPLPKVGPPAYELLDELGRGGMGVVYRARDVALCRDVAVKVLRDEFSPQSAAAARFLDEAYITGQMQHPGIPAIHQVGALADGRPFLAMKLIKGRTLDALLKDRPDPSADRGRFLAVFEQVCQAVGYAHAHSVIHRDLKPANVMVGDFGDVQVMDWGLAKVMAGGLARPGRPSDDSDATIGSTQIRSTRGEDGATQAGSLLGTPAFMPPEQAIGAVDQIDARSDVFGLGAILCVILTGSPPHVGANSEATRQLAARAKLDDAFVRLDSSGADPELVALAKRCLAAEKGGRPRDASEVAAAVAGLRANAEERARQAEQDRVRAEVRAAEQRKRRKVQLALAGAVVLLLAGSGTFAWWADRESTERRVETENRNRDERECRTRNADAVAALLGQCEDALRSDDADKAALALEQAEKRSAEGAADHLADRLARCRDDLAMLRELDRINDLRWTVIEGQFQGDAKAVEQWPKAFARFGIVPSTLTPGEAGRRVNESVIRGRLLAALDMWLAYAPPLGLLAVLRAADPDDFRDAVRAAVVAGANARLAELADKAVALDQPAPFAAVLGELDAIPVDRRKAILAAVWRRRPADFGLLMALQRLNKPRFDRRKLVAEREKWLRAAVAVRPGSVVAHIDLGDNLLDAGNFEGAIAEYRVAIGIDPKYPSVHNSLGDALRNKGDLDGAIAACREAIRLDPKFHWPHLHLGLTLMDQGNPDAAVAAILDASRLNPNEPHIRYGLGLALKAQGNLDGAIAAFREGIRLDRRAYILHELGLALRDKGELDGAIAMFKEVLRLDPNNSAARANLDRTMKLNADRDGNESHGSSPPLEAK